MCTIPPKQPIIGEVFSTQAGIHQTGVRRSDEAGGGPIYLPFDAAMVGDEAVEQHRIGALSGMDGIVSVLNRKVKEETGQEGTYSNVSRAVKHVYDHIQASYDGAYDRDSDTLVNQRRTFFSAEEIPGPGPRGRGRAPGLRRELSGLHSSPCQPATGAYLASIGSCRDDRLRALAVEISHDTVAALAREQSGGRPTAE